MAELNPGAARSDLWQVGSHGFDISAHVDPGKSSPSSPPTGAQVNGHISSSVRDATSDEIHHESFNMDSWVRVPAVVKRQAMRYAVTSLFKGVVLDLGFDPSSASQLFGPFEAERKPIRSERHMAYYEMTQQALRQVEKVLPALIALHDKYGIQGDIKSITGEIKTVAIKGYPGIFLRQGTSVFPPALQISLSQRVVYLSRDLLDEMNMKKRVDRAILGVYYAKAVLNIAAFDGVDRRQVIADNNLYLSVRDRISKMEHEIIRAVAGTVPTRVLTSRLQELSEIHDRLAEKRIASISLRAHEGVHEFETIRHYQRRNQLIGTEQENLDRLKNLADDFSRYGFCVHRDQGFEEAKTWYKRAFRALGSAQKIDSRGLYPFYVQSDRVEFALRLGLLRRFRKELTRLFQAQYTSPDELESQNTVQNLLLPTWIKQSVPALRGRLDALRGPFGPGINTQEIDLSRKHLDSLIETCFAKSTYR